ncbi:metal-dependent hydrolase [Haloarcula laminariae]|uniref:metal-dependent hydrolase n=1 Tax=Haloarcula laminariae TaxID=2961577 RepID=UPI0021C653AB|nr:metal-dependent hydrolase [Halomicroarcula laminariae]
MFPWTHFAFGYLLLVCCSFLLGRRISKAELVAVLIGTQLADFVDKPLAWWFAAVPSGRSLAHSLLVAVPLSLVVLAVAWHRSYPEVGFAFGLGYVSHLIGDTYVALYYWRVEEFTFLLWPILPPYPYDDTTGFGNFLAELTITTRLLATAAVCGVVGLVVLVQFVRAPRWPTRRAN